MNSERVYLRGPDGRVIVTSDKLVGSRLTFPVDSIRSVWIERSGPGWLLSLALCVSAAAAMYGLGLDWPAAASAECATVAMLAVRRRYAIVVVPRVGRPMTARTVAGPDEADDIFQAVSRSLAEHSPLARTA